MTYWPDIATLWAREDDGRKRDRALVRHALLMKVVERKTLDDFRAALEKPDDDWSFHLSNGVGYELERLEAEFAVVFGARIDSLASFCGIGKRHDAALEALGNARRAVRHEAPMNDRQSVGQELARATARLYRRIEGLFPLPVRRRFIEDGLTRTQAELDGCPNLDDRIAAQKARLLTAMRRARNRQSPSRGRSSPFRRT